MAIFFIVLTIAMASTLAFVIGEIRTKLSILYLWTVSIKVVPLLDRFLKKRFLILVKSLYTSPPMEKVKPAAILKIFDRYL